MQRKLLTMLELASSEGCTACVDESGRGSLVFDVCAAAVVWAKAVEPGDKMIELINDSKKLTPKKREKLAEYIKEHALAWGIGTASADEIDRHNILQANFMAMHRALDTVYAKCKFDKIEIDGNAFKPYIPPGEDDADWLLFECIVDGDAKKLGIAAASILAKVHRDEQIAELCKENPELDERYGLLSNKGYGTKKHMEGLKVYGPSKYHRKTFAPVSKWSHSTHN